MMDRVNEHNRLLAEKTEELERSYHQIRKYFAVVHEVGAQPDFESAGTYLIVQLGKNQQQVLGIYLRPAVDNDLPDLAITVGMNLGFHFHCFD